MYNNIITSVETPVKYRFSARGDFDGKDMQGANPATGWQRVEWSMSDLFRHAATGGAMGVSVWKDDYRNAENTLETHILGLDFEHGELSAEDLIADDFLKPFAGVIMPTASDNPDDPRARVFIPLSRSVSADEYKTLFDVFAARYQGAIDTATSDVSRFFFGARLEYTTEIDDDGEQWTDFPRGYINDDALLDVDSFLIERHDSAFQSASKSNDKALSCHSIPDKAKRLEIGALIANLADFQPASFANIEDKAVALAADKLQFCTRLYTDKGKPSYGLWMHLWMAAHSATNGSEVMLDLICDHPVFSPFWESDTKHENGRALLRNSWSKRVAPEAGDEGLITGRTLDYYARMCGWGTYSQYDLKRVDLTIDAIELADALTFDSIPLGRNVLLKQQTGGGKSRFSLAYAFDGGLQAKEIGLIAPFVALTVDANAKAVALGLDSKHYQDDELAGGHMVTGTLQHFSRWYEASRFKLVIIEEIHAIIGHLLTNSHMSAQEKWRGIEWLQELFRSDATVLMVDAGINQNTVDFVEGLAKSPSYVIHNVGKRQKADIYLVSEEDAVAELIEVLNVEGKVAVTTDKPATAQEHKELLSAWDTKILVVTGETSKQRGVRQALADIEQTAADHTLIYNAAMGTGVSILKTKPDLLVQVMEMLPARDQIQHLNRFRQQGRVLLVPKIEGRTRYTEQEYRARSNRVYGAEKEALEMLLREVSINDQRSELAAFIDTMNARLLAEQNEQLIDPLAYYAKVLADDGRVLYGKAQAEASERMLQIRSKSKEQTELLKPRWREGQVIDEKQSEIPDMTDEQLILSELATTVARSFMGTPETGYRQLSDLQIVGAAIAFDGSVRHIERALGENEDFAATLATVMDNDRPQSAAYLFAATYLLLTASAYIFPDLTKPITHETLVKRAGAYVEMIGILGKQYDAFIGDSRYSLATMRRDYSDESELAIALMRKILNKVGMRFKKSYRQVRIDGERMKARDEQGRLIATYTLDNLNELLALLQHRHDKRGMEGMISTVWSTSRLIAESSMIDDLISRGYLEEWAKEVNRRGRDEKWNVYQELLDRDRDPMDIL